MHGITIRYVGLIRNTLGKQEEIVDIAEDATVRNLLELLDGRYKDDFRTVVFGTDGQLRPTTTLLLDGTDATEIGGLDAILNDVTNLTILALVYPTAGG